MWVHGLGWTLPRNVVSSSCMVYRDGTLLCGGFLEPHADPAFCAGPQHHFRHHVLCGPWPLYRPATPAEVAACERPPHGLQLLPRHCLHVHLRMQWPSTYRPAAAHWPLNEWTLYLCPWVAASCRPARFPWLPSTYWHPVPPEQNIPIAVRYHTISQQAEWTFRLTVK
jgi:hypothetical protein